MKFITVLLLLISLFRIQANGYAQNTRISLEMENISLEAVLASIESKSDFRFLYNHEKIDIERTVSVSARRDRISAILDTLFASTDIAYTVQNKLIILRNRNEAGDIENNPVGVGRQQSTVSGTVTDEGGIPLPGATVMEQGTNNGASTDFDGNYSLELTSDSPILEVSYIGYATQEVAVNGRVVVDITMIEDASQLDEVVVTALGIRKEAKALGYAVSTVDTDRIEAVGAPVNAVQALYGAAPGVAVAATATGPTGGMKINIRNAISFDQNSTTRPLIVVDGIPIHDENTEITYNSRAGRDNGTGINDINPDDIESFQILKGAKASVLYGSEGANGVILITTKSGSRSRGLGISASLTTTTEKGAFFPDLQDQYGTGRSPSNSATDAEGYFIDVNGQRILDPGGVGFGPKYDPNVNLVWWDGSVRPWVANRRSVYDQLLRTGQQRVANVAVSSGGERGSMRFSYTNTKYEPIFRGSEFSRNSFSLNTSYDLNDHISIKYVANYYLTDNLNSAYAGSFDAQGARAELGAYTRDIDVDLLRRFLVTDNGYNYFQNPDRRQNFISNGRSSVVGTLWDWTQNESIFNRVHNIQSLTLDLTFSDVFGATILGGIDHTAERNTYKGRLEDPTLIGPNSGSVFRDVDRNIRQTYGQALLNFNKDFNKLGFSGFVGGAIRNDFLEEKGAEKIGGMVIPNYFSFTNLPSGVQPQYIFNNEEEILYSLLGSVQLEWDDQIYLEAQARQDWSSILPEGNNSYFYPGLSATWILSNSINMPEAVKFLKLRTSWADVGRPGPRYFSNVNLGVSQSGGGFILEPPNDLPPIDDDFVPNLKPERKREFEVGIEGYFFENQRLGLDFSLYHSNTYDQIMPVTAPPGYGVQRIRLNAGDVANTGWELGIKTIPFMTDNLRWNVDLTFSAAKTKVLELDGDLESLELWSTNGLNAVAEVGGEYGLIYQNQGFQNYINPSDDNDPNNGARIVDNSGARYRYSSSSNRLVGKLLPDVVGGLFTRLDYKNFGLALNMDYSFGATFINEAETYMMAAGVLDESLPYRDTGTGGVPYYVNDSGQRIAGANPGTGPTYNDGVLLDGVLPDGTPNTQVVPAQDYYYQSYFSNGFFPEDRLFKSDYIALRNITLDYRLPDLSRKIGLTDLVLSIFANNVAYIYKAAPNTNPEASNGTGWNNANYGTTALPIQRVLGLSVSAKL